MTCNSTANVPQLPTLRDRLPSRLPPPALPRTDRAGSSTPRQWLTAFPGEALPGDEQAIVREDLAEIHDPVLHSQAVRRRRRNLGVGRAGAAPAVRPERGVAPDALGAGRSEGCADQAHGCDICETRGRWQQGRGEILPRRVADAIARARSGGGDRTGVQSRAGVGLERVISHGVSSRY
jgi:hypothetical protein